MPKTKSHVTVGQLNSALGRTAKKSGVIKAFRHTTAKGESLKPAQTAPKRQIVTTPPPKPAKGVPVADVSGGGVMKKRRST